MEINDSNAIGNNDMKTEEVFEPFEDSTEKQLDERKAQLDAMEKELLEKADKNAADEKRLEEMRQDLDRREKSLTAKESENIDESSRLKKIAEALDKRDNDITERELEAAEGFKKLREREFSKAAAELQNEINMLQDKKLALISEQEELRRSLIDETNKKVASIISEATSARTDAEKLLEENLHKQEKLDESKASIDEKESELEICKNILIAEKNKLRETALNLAEQMSEETKSQLDMANKSRDDLRSENEKLRKQVNDFEHTQRAANGRTMEQLVEAENKYMERIRQLENKLILFEREKADVDLLKSKVQEYDSLLDKNKELSKENEKLRKENLSYVEQRAGAEMLESRVRILQNQSQNAVYERDAAKASAEALAAEMEVLKQTIESLKTIAERPAEREARINDIMSISFADKCAERKAASEIEWLNGIAEKIAASNIRISRRLLYAFHTSLKTAEWSPITVLAGVSGTGKSLLPKLYAMYGGFYYMPLAVQPDWDSSQSLFGFFNALDNKFNATKLLSALVQFQPDNPNSLSEYMMIVLLDEMNLAYVELYFSELLSKLEDRRGSGKAITIDVDLGSGLEKYGVELDRNIFWIGTMNEDETTKTLSDKVIDRSNMLSFPRPKEFARRLSAELVKEDDKKLPKTVWEDWVGSAAKIDEDILNRYKVTVEKINEALGEVGRALGHRVWQAIENYICSHPCCIDAAPKGDKDKLDSSVQTAFEEAVVFKIMPKLRGIEITKQTVKVCFDPIKESLCKDAPGIVADFNRAVSGDQFIWRTSDYLEC